MTNWIRRRLILHVDEARTIAFIGGFIVVMWWAFARISPNPQVVGIVSIMVLQRGLSFKKGEEDADADAAEAPQSSQQEVLESNDRNAKDLGSRRSERRYIPRPHCGVDLAH